MENKCNSVLDLHFENNQTYKLCDKITYKKRNTFELN